MSKNYKRSYFRDLQRFPMYHPNNSRAIYELEVHISNIILHLKKNNKNPHNKIDYTKRLIQFGIDFGNRTMRPMSKQILKQYSDFCQKISLEVIEKNLTPEEHSRKLDMF